jgi:hypothetical protein
MHLVAAKLVSRAFAGTGPARESVDGFHLHPPLLHAVLGDLDVAATSEAASAAFLEHFLEGFCKPNTLAPEIPVAVGVEAVKKNDVAGLERRIKIGSRLLEHRSVGFADYIYALLTRLLRLRHLA